MSKVKIVLDADVIIHFSKGGFLSILAEIFPTYDYVVLDKVYQEIKDPIKSQLDNLIQFLGKIQVLNYNPKGLELLEYAQLTKFKGKGESACLAFCRFNPNVIGSSNLTDIKSYCKQYNITYLTTLDFLYFAIKRNIISISNADNFIQEVRAKDSTLPDISMRTYISQAIL
jgi:hypothetical protein